MKKTKSDETYMREALRLAGKAAGMTSPDPMVGAVVVRGGKIVGKGYHAEVGTPHAESFALLRAGRRARGATIYVNLEPCCHFGNNPPCVDQIIDAGIKRVVASMKDPNPLVAGRGFSALRRSGVKVKLGVLEDEARELNEAFIKRMIKKRPFCILKSAMSLDGKIATVSGESKWISSRRSRQFVHLLRSRVDAVMTGINTVLSDDPRFDTRLLKRASGTPHKVVIDPKALIPLSSNILSREPGKAVIVVTKKASGKRTARITALGARVIVAQTKRDGRIDLDRLMATLSEAGILSVMIEAGGGLAASALEQGIVDRVVFFIAPVIIGGSAALTPVEGEGVKKLADSIKLDRLKTRRLGGDIVVEGYVR